MKYKWRLTLVLRTWLHQTRKLDQLFQIKLSRNFYGKSLMTLLHLLWVNQITSWPNYMSVPISLWMSNLFSPELKTLVGVLITTFPQWSTPRKFNYGWQMISIIMSCPHMEVRSDTMLKFFNVNCKVCVWNINRTYLQSVRSDIKWAVHR